MKTNTGFFEETPGCKSSTRLNSFLLLLFFMGFNLLWIQDNDITGNLIILDALVLVGIFASKYVHKLAELALRIKGGQEINSDKQ